MTVEKGIIDKERNPFWCKWFEDHDYGLTNNPKKEITRKDMLVDKFGRTISNNEPNLG